MSRSLWSLCNSWLSSATSVFSVSPSCSFEETKSVEERGQIQSAPISFTGNEEKGMELKPLGLLTSCEEKMEDSKEKSFVQRARKSKLAERLLGSKFRYTRWDFFVLAILPKTSLCFQHWGDASLVPFKYGYKHDGECFAVLLWSRRQANSVCKAVICIWNCFFANAHGPPHPCLAALTCCLKGL